MGFFYKMNDRFMTKTTWLKAGLGFIASQVVYFIMLFITIPAVEAHARGMKIFDLMPLGYSPEYAAKLLEGLGEKGRDLYLTNQIPLDMLYPGLMGVTGALLITLLSKKVNQRLSLLMFLPVLAAVFDYLENAMTTVMLLSFPKLPQTIYFAANIFTIIKSFLTVLYLGVLLILFSVFLYNLLRNNNKIIKKVRG